MESRTRRAGHVPHTGCLHLLHPQKAQACQPLAEGHGRPVIAEHLVRVAFTVRQLHRSEHQLHHLDATLLIHMLGGNAGGIHSIGLVENATGRHHMLARIIHLNTPTADGCEPRGNRTPAIDAIHAVQHRYHRAPRKKEEQTSSSRAARTGIAGALHGGVNVSMRAGVP